MLQSPYVSVKEVCHGRVDPKTLKALELLIKQLAGIGSNTCKSALPGQFDVNQLGDISQDTVSRLILKGRSRTKA